MQAAVEDFALYWQKMTGHDARSSAGDTHASGREIAVYIGRANVPGALAHAMNLDGLSEDEYCIKTVTTAEGKALVIAGGSDRGTSYGVFDFLERCLGIRWLTPDYTYIPAAPASIPDTAVRYKPIFEYRDTTYLTAANLKGIDAFRRFHRIYPGPGFSCHTSYALVPPDEHFQTHPEYYSLRGGKRVAPVGVNMHSLVEQAKHPDKLGQLCYSNPAVAETVFEQFKRQIDRNPAEKTLHLSQQDWINNCECGACQTIDEREGTPMGSVLTCINRIADMLQAQRPGYSVETLAYWYTRKPPKKMVPRDNVVIKLCSIECDFFRPLDDPDAELNRDFVSDIMKWSAIAKRLHIWDYTPNYAHFSMPHPNFHVLFPNARFFAEHKVKGLFEQGAEIYGGEFCYLRTYMVMKCMWNPYLDGDAVRDEFIDLYYGKAAPYIKEYIELAASTVRDSGRPMTCFDEGRWLTLPFIEAAEGLFQKALAAAESDDIRKRVELEHVHLKFAAIVCAPSVTITDAMLTSIPAATASIDDYLAAGAEAGIHPTPPYGTLKEALPPRLVSMSPDKTLQTPVVALENSRYRVWVVPGLQGTVLRWTDKKHKVELLRAYKTLGRDPGSWQDWMNATGVPEGPVAAAYDVVRQAKDSLTIKATLRNGLVLERTMTLLPDSDTLDVSLSVHNPTAEPIAPIVKTHPEFFTQGSKMPEIWAFDGAEWTQLNTSSAAQQKAFGVRLEPGSYTRLAAYLPNARVSVLARFVPAQLGELLYFYNLAPNAQHVNLELIMAPTPLSPNETRTVEAAYSVVKGKPAKRIVK